MQISTCQRIETDEFRTVELRGLGVLYSILCVKKKGIERACLEDCIGVTTSNLVRGGSEGGNIFTRFFPITGGSRNETLVLKEADCINFVQIQFADLAHC